MLGGAARKLPSKLRKGPKKIGGSGSPPVACGAKSGPSLRILRRSMKPLELWNRFAYCCVVLGYNCQELKRPTVSRQCSKYFSMETKLPLVLMLTTRSAVCAEPAWDEHESLEQKLTARVVAQRYSACDHSESALLVKNRPQLQN